MTKDLARFLERAAPFCAAFFIASSLLAAEPFVWEDFELGTSYWGTQFEGSLMTDGTIASDFPSHGKYGYRGHFTLPAGGGRIAFSTAQTGDLTGATSLTVDLYNSSPLTFTGQVIVKQGAQWSWYKTDALAVNPGWNKDMVFNLSSLKTADSGIPMTVALTDLHQLALVFETKEQGDGYLYMDYVRMAGADPTKVVILRPEEMATGSPVTITGFEDGSCPLTPDSAYSSAVGAESVTVSTTEGARAALLTYNNKQPDDKAAYNLQADMDLSKATGVVFDAYNPLSQEVDASIFVNTGANWDYYESATVPLKPGWNRNVTFALKSKTFKSAASNWTNSAGVAGLAVTRKLGIAFMPHQITRSFFLLDNLRLLSNEPAALEGMVHDLFPPMPAITGTDHLLEGFEGTGDGWSAQTGTSKATDAVILSTSNTTEGTHLLKTSFEFDASGQSAWFGVDQAMNLKDSSAVKVDIFNPGTAPLQAAIVLKLGDTYDWCESTPIMVKPGWNRDVTFPLKAKTFKTALANWQYHAYAEPLDQVKSLYIGFTSAGAMKGSAYLDNIRVAGASAVAMGPAAAKHVLKGREVLFDPLTGASADGWLASTGANANSFAIISGYGKFQGENAVDMQYRTIIESQSAGFAKTAPLDWGNVLGLQVDFFNPQSYTVNFTLAVKTGPNSEWQETSEFSLKPGWNRKVQVDITQPIFKSLATNWSSQDFLRDRNDIRSLIINVYPHHPGSGHLLMTNVKTIERDLIGGAAAGAGAGQVFGFSTETQLQARAYSGTLLESFEGNIGAWQPVAGAVVAQSTLFPTQGSHSLRIDYQSSFVPNAAIPEVQYAPAAPLDFSRDTNIQFDVYNAGASMNLSLAFYTGPPYNGNNNGEYIESNTVPIVPGWNRNVTIPLIGNNFKSGATAYKLWDTLRNANQIHQMHVKLNNTVGRGTVYLDNIRLLGASGAPGQTDGIAKEQVTFKFNPSDDIQLVAVGSVAADGQSPAQTSLDKVRLDVRGGNNQFSLFTGDQLSGTDDPMQILSGAQLGSQIFGVDERFNFPGVLLAQASAFAEYGSSPNTLGNTSGYLLRLKSVEVNDTWIGAGFLDTRFGNVPGSNPLSADVESDVKTYEADFDSYLRDIHLQLLGEVAQSSYAAFPGSPYNFTNPAANAYYAGVIYQLGAFQFQGYRLEHQLNFFAPFSSAAYQGSDQNSVQLYWQADTFSLVKDMQRWGNFWNDFLTGLNFQVQYYDYSSMTDTYDNHGLRAILQNNNYKSPLFMNFWWYWYDEGQSPGDTMLPNPADNTHELITTSNYELHYQLDSKFSVSGLFRDSFTDFWETFTYDAGMKWKFWGNTWLAGDVKYVNQTGSRFGQYTNVTVGLTKYLLDNTMDTSLTYGVPSFVNYWEDDNNLQTVNQLSFSLNDRF